MFYKLSFIEFICLVNSFFIHNTKIKIISVSVHIIFNLIVNVIVSLVPVCVLYPLSIKVAFTNRYNDVFANDHTVLDSNWIFLLSTKDTFSPRTLAWLTRGRRMCRSPKLEFDIAFSRDDAFSIVLSLITSVVWHFPWTFRECQSFFSGGLACHTVAQIGIRHFRRRRKKNHTRVRIQKRRSSLWVWGNVPALVCSRGTLKTHHKSVFPESLQRSLKAQSISLLSRENSISF